MKNVLAFFFSALTMCIGCSTVERVEHYQREQWIPDAQKELLNKEAEVTTIDGHTYFGNIIQLSNDSLWVLCEYLKSPMSLPLSRVNSIQPSRNVIPPIGGSLAGIVVGGAIGASIAANQEPDPRNQDVISRGLEKLGNGMAYSLLGATIGGLALGVTAGAVSAVTDYQIGHSAPHLAPVKARPAANDSTQKGK